MTLRVLPVNASTVLVELADLDEALALHASLTVEPMAGILELLPAARTVMLRFDRSQSSPEMIVDLLSQRDLSRRSRPSGSLVEIPVRYDGEDLAEVARLSGLSVEEVVRRHQASEFSVAFCGFAPGFAYLVGGDPALHVPRLATPRTQVPAGSVALGGVYCGVYPQATPGGWRIIGTTTLPMWDSSRDPPALLTPGARVRFIADAAATTSQPHAARQPSITQSPTTPPTARDAPQITVVTAMLPATLQDLGRPGYAHLGVAPAGAMDHAALMAANLAVGNPPGAPCLEISFGSFAVECSDAVTVAVAGAPAPIGVRRASGGQVEGALGQPIALGRGDRLTLGYPARGVRSYLAVRGGFAVPRSLGSASRDTLAALGPAPVTKGAVLAVGDVVAGAAAMDAAMDASMTGAAAPPLPASGDVVELDVHPGPRADGFTADAVALLHSQRWRVTPQSSRVGLRLQGERPLQRRDAAELPSEGVVRGAIQVPHEGQPVLLLADHPLTGGYPVIAVVAEHHLDLAGQIPPGARVLFRAIAPSAAIHPKTRA